MLKHKSVVFFLVLIFFVILGCSSYKKAEQEQFLYGTTIRAVIYDKTGKGKELIENCFKLMEEIDKKFNSRSNSGEFYKINSSAGKEGIVVSDEAVDLIKRNFEMSDITNGSYDITMEPLFKLWGFEQQTRDKLPTTDEIRFALQNIGYKRVSIDGNRVKLPAGFSIESGPFLKGYGIHKAAEYLRKNGVKSGIITGVSSIETIGRKPDGSKWKIGVQNPKNPEEMLGVLELDNKSVGVSGDYQTFIEIDGKRYHHILSLKDGFPIKDIKLVVIVSDDSSSADIYDTALFACGKDKIEEAASKIEGIEWLYVDSEMKLHQSKGMADYFKTAGGVLSEKR